VDQAVPNLTKLERRMGEWLTRRGVEYLVKPRIRVDRSGKRRRLEPDFLVPDEHLLIEVNGCFVHGCPECYGGHGSTSVRSRDERRLAELRKAGYEVEVVWEHELEALGA